jgi:3'-phosphoadenosine 5'-phosphosulfate sulfotransferase (PAPS reductase)/FAD synthetase
MSNPYKIDGPAIVSFSGGRTSGFMLASILAAHGGTLPDDVRVVFNNTGLEHQATYEFVREVGERMCPVTWLEYRRDSGTNTFAVVTPETASKNGEPFAALIESRSYLPNPITRFCTVELKIRTTARYVKSLGWSEYENAVGLRADEPRRVAKMKGDSKNEHVLMPIAAAGHTIDDVRAYWKSAAFDLQLPDNDNAWGNCVGCFLKGRHKLERMMQTDPDAFRWWAEQESKMGKTFRIDRPTYSQMLVQVRVQGRVFEQAEDDTIPCMCTE